MCLCMSSSLYDTYWFLIAFIGRGNKKIKIFLVKKMKTAQISHGFYAKKSFSAAIPSALTESWLASWICT